MRGFRFSVVTLVGGIVDGRFWFESRLSVADLYGGRGDYTGTYVLTYQGGKVARIDTAIALRLPYWEGYKSGG